MANERNELTNPKVEEKKRKILQRKAKEERNSYVVPKPSDGKYILRFQTSCESNICRCIIVISSQLVNRIICSSIYLLLVS